MKFFVSLFRLNPYSNLGDYMHRWWLLEARGDKSGKAARVHHILRSDHDRALHDHPWDNCSIVLRGGYWEVTPGRYQAWVERDIEQAPPELQRLHACIHRSPGNAVDRSLRREFEAEGVSWRRTFSKTKRSAEDMHRLVLPEGREAWSLFITWPKRREWGFATPEGWIHNADYLQALGRAA